MEYRGSGTRSRYMSTEAAPPDFCVHSKGYSMSDSTTVRLEAFSDGVFAIAVTLLILEIKVPSANDLSQVSGLWHALAERWPSYVGFVASFFIIGVMWANHHALFEYIRRVDRRLLLANLLLLMGVSFLQYPTAVLAQNLADPATRTDATVFYGLTLVFTSLTYNLVWWLGRLVLDGILPVAEEYDGKMASAGRLACEAQEREGRAQAVLMLV